MTELMCRMQVQVHVQNASAGRRVGGLIFLPPSHEPRGWGVCAYVALLCLYLFFTGTQTESTQTYGVELTLLPAVGELPIPAAGEPTLCMQPVPQASRTAVTRAPARYRPSAGRTPEVSPRPPRSSCQRCRASLTSASTPRWSHLIKSIGWCTTMPGPPRPVSKDQSCAKRLCHWLW